MKKTSNNKDEQNERIRTIEHVLYDNLIVTINVGYYSPCNLFIDIK